MSRVPHPRIRSESAAVDFPPKTNDMISCVVSLVGEVTSRSESCFTVATDQSETPCTRVRRMFVPSKLCSPFAPTHLFVSDCCCCVIFQFLLSFLFSFF